MQVTYNYNFCGPVVEVFFILFFPFNNLYAWFSSRIEGDFLDHSVFADEGNYFSTLPLSAIAEVKEQEIESSLSTQKIILLNWRACI